MMSTERIVLPDCCEDWVLAYGAFYAVDSTFHCVECGSAWHKLKPGRFESPATGQIWSVQARVAENTQHRYLEAENGQNPLTPRCCTKLILDYGERIKLGRRFNCPICGSAWEKKEIEQHRHQPVVAYTNSSSGVTVAVQQGATRRFIVPLEEYQPWAGE
jgi:hypothetical protein